MSALFKESVLDPVIKKDSTDHEIYQNYRTILNLLPDSLTTWLQLFKGWIELFQSILIILIEWIIAIRPLNSRGLVDNNLLEIFQSAYQKGHITETALT